MTIPPNPAAGADNRLLAAILSGAAPEEVAALWEARQKAFPEAPISAYLYAQISMALPPDWTPPK